MHAGECSKVTIQQSNSFDKPKSHYIQGNVPFYLCMIMRVLVYVAKLLNLTKFVSAHDGPQLQITYYLAAQMTQIPILENLKMMMLLVLLYICFVSLGICSV